MNRHGSSKEDIKARLLETFKLEAEEHLQAMTANLVTLNQELPPAEVQSFVEATFREAHTLKGAARSVGLTDVEGLCQALESILSRLKRGDLSLTRPILHTLRQAIDGLALLLSDAKDGTDVGTLINLLERAGDDHHDNAQEPIEERGRRTMPGAPPLGIPFGDTVRLGTARLDVLLFQAEDLLVAKLAVEERLIEARAVAELLSHCRMALKTNGRRTLPADVADAVRSAEVQARELLSHLARDQRTVLGVVDGLQEGIRRLRLMPVSTVLDLFPRMVQDLAGQKGKEVEWVAEGAALEVDRKVLEAMKDPLIHLVRNAIDHGIEPPDVRMQTGKASRGRVTVSIVPLEGGRIEICVRDDGAGIDPARVREAAVRAHLLTAQHAQSLSDEDALDLIYRSGISTSPIITDVSGHGLGLAIVRERVEKLDGAINVQTAIGVGTTIRMILPASIATFRGLLVRASGQPFLLPLEAIERVTRFSTKEVQTLEGREVVYVNGHPLPVRSLGAILGLPDRKKEDEPEGAVSCLIMRSGEERTGLFVEEILGEQEALVKEIKPPLLRVRYVASAGLLGTGRVVLILRPTDLLKAVRASPRLPTLQRPPEEHGRQKAILVVDDSITTRQMERNILEAVGYRVRVAVDGVEAWTALKSEEFDLVVSDVDMPRMDGFELTARIRADRKLAELPVVLVTALEAREDKERGVEVGANAYIIKSSFDQSNLLEIIRRLI